MFNKNNIFISTFEYQKIWIQTSNNYFEKKLKSKKTFKRVFELKGRSLMENQHVF